LVSHRGERRCEGCLARAQIARLNDTSSRMSVSPTFSSRLRAVVALLILAGCASRAPRTVAPAPTPPYVAPGATVPVARLVMRSEIEEYDTYEVAVLSNADACSGKQSVGMGFPRNDPRSTTLAAGRWQTIEVQLNKPNRTYCRVRWSFAPAAGRSYVVSTTSEKQGCSVVIRDETDPDAVRIEPSLRRRDVDARACIPLAQTHPALHMNTHATTEEVTDLPIEPVDREPSKTRPPVAKDPIPTVTPDDLQGLIGR
jgi:hypothetical protein